MFRPIIALALPDYFYFVFAVCVLVSACIVLFYAKRHPNPHFRPRKSDITIVSFVLLFVSGGVAFMTAGSFDAEFDKEKIEKQEEDAKRMAKMRGTTIEEEMGIAEGEPGTPAATTESGTGKNPDLPEDIPDEIREIIEGGQ